MKTSRQEAIAKGLIKYHGKPCKNCGTDEKYTLNGACVACQAGHVKKQRDKIREARSA